jgi:outer membrane protein assembly factor BamB
MRTVNTTRAALLGAALLIGTGAALAQDWPQWRGPNRDNHVTGFKEPKTWPKTLKQDWKVTVGDGESSPVMAGDKIYVFARQGGDEVIWCLDAGSGKEIWKDKYAATAVKGPAAPHPGTRSTPSVGEGKVCTLGVNGTVSCWDAATGKFLWRKEKGNPKFYTSSSPIIADGKCIVFAGALTAFDLANGEEKWKWSAGAPYGSPVLATIEGVLQIVTPAVGKLAGINLANGKPLWDVTIGTDYWSNYSTPIIDGSTVIYSEPVLPGKGKTGGKTRAFKVEKKGDAFSATQLWEKPLAAHGYHTPLLKGNLLFGVNTAKNFFCMDVKTGNVLWTDKTSAGDCGCILDTGSVLLAQCGDNRLLVVEPSDKGFKEIAHYQVGDGPTWAVPIVAGNHVYVKSKGKDGTLTMYTLE